MSVLYGIQNNSKLNMAYNILRISKRNMSYHTST